MHVLLTAQQQIAVSESSRSALSPQARYYTIKSPHNANLKPNRQPFPDQKSTSTSSSMNARMNDNGARRITAVDCVTGRPGSGHGNPGNSGPSYGRTRTSGWQPRGQSAARGQHLEAQLRKLQYLR